jgi:hypothetical protein
MKVTLSKDFAGFKPGHTFECNQYLFEKLSNMSVIELSGSEPAKSDDVVISKKRKSVKSK